jgi:hypothetical protein
MPACVIEPPPVSTTDQLTPVFEEFVTVAVNVRDAPVLSGLDAPETLTLTLGEGPEEGAEYPVPPHP